MLKKPRAEFFFLQRNMADQEKRNSIMKFQTNTHDCLLFYLDLMDEFNAIFENDDGDNRLFDTKRPLNYARGVCFMFADKFENTSASLSGNKW